MLSNIYSKNECDVRTQKLTDWKTLRSVAAPEPRILTRHRDVSKAVRKAKVDIANVNNTGANGIFVIGDVVTEAPRAVRNVAWRFTVVDFYYKDKLK